MKKLSDTLRDDQASDAKCLNWVVRRTTCLLIWLKSLVNSSFIQFKSVSSFAGLERLQITTQFNDFITMIMQRTLQLKLDTHCTSSYVIEEDCGVLWVMGVQVLFVKQTGLASIVSGRLESRDILGCSNLKLLSRPCKRWEDNVKQKNNFLPTKLAIICWLSPFKSDRTCWYCFPLN